jgi:hypothetical protein
VSLKIIEFLKNIFNSGILQLLTDSWGAEFFRDLWKIEIEIKISKFQKNGPGVGHLTLGHSECTQRTKIHTEKV